METASGARRGNIFSHTFGDFLCSRSWKTQYWTRAVEVCEMKKKKLFFASGMNSHWQWILYEICVLFAMIIITGARVRDTVGNHTVLLRRQGDSYFYSYFSCFYLLFFFIRLRRLSKLARISFFLFISLILLPFAI